MSGLFKSRDINKYLDCLAELLLKYNLGCHEILLVGGAQVALCHRFSRATEDVDICFKSQNGLNNCCLEVARKFGLREDWMNSGVMRSPSYSYRLYEKAELHKVYRDVLYVYAIHDIDLLCMKLVSYRQKDLGDIRKISKLLKSKGYKYEDIISNGKYLYEGLGVSPSIAALKELRSLFS